LPLCSPLSLPSSSFPSQATEKELRVQLASYSGKFEVFQQSLEQSNAAFKQYRERLDEMGKAKLK
jgi:hypothetical protein